MRNVPTYIRPHPPEILKVSLRDAGPVSILRHSPLANPPFLFCSSSPPPSIVLFREYILGYVRVSILKAACTTLYLPAPPPLLPHDRRRCFTTSRGWCPACGLIKRKKRRKNQEFQGFFTINLRCSRQVGRGYEMKFAKFEFAFNLNPVVFNVRIGPLG